MDERQPLLQSREFPNDMEDKGTLVQDSGIHSLTCSPVNWRRGYKWTIVALLAFFAFTSNSTCTALAPVAKDIVEDLGGTWNSSSKFSSVLLITIWELGEAAGPLLIAPLSEEIGRYPVVTATSICFAIAVILASLATSMPVVITARFLTGVSNAASVLNPAIVGDMFPSEERGAAISLIMLATLCICCLIFDVFRETYAPLVCAIGDGQPGDNGFANELFPSRDKTNLGRRWRQAILRPILLFKGSSILQMLSLFGGVLYSFFYIDATTLPDILSKSYRLSESHIGMAFMSFTVGSSLATIICNRFLDRIYIQLRRRHGQDNAEHRLPLLIVAAVLLPPLVLLYGWSAETKASLYLSLLSVALLGFAILLGLLPLAAYAVDAFGIYSASAMTAVTVVRCLGGTFLPLVVGPSVARIGYGWTFTWLAVLAACVAPIPAVVMRYGSMWRARSEISR